MTRVAAVDCGTNSIRLLVADVGPGGLVDLTRRMEIVRLGEGVDRTGQFAPEALGRTLTALRGYADDIARLGTDRVRMVATRKRRCRSPGRPPACPANIPSRTWSPTSVAGLRSSS